MPSSLPSRSCRQIIQRAATTSQRRFQRAVDATSASAFRNPPLDKAELGRCRRAPARNDFREPSAVGKKGVDSGFWSTILIEPQQQVTVDRVPPRASAACPRSTSSFAGDDSRWRVD